MFYEPQQPHGLKRDPFKCLVVPRPIGWISTLDAAGRRNLAPFSFFNAVASDPPVVVLGISGAHFEGGQKDSFVNIEATGEFVCNLATWTTREAMNMTSAGAPRAVDEFELAGLTPLASRLVAPPRVKESPVHLECRYLQTVPLPANDPASPNNAIFGQVVGIHIDDAFIKDGMIDQAALKPIARLGYMDYAAVESLFTMERPVYEDVAG
jgi:flavin reductase (DIM6/NTAB) family NADH-FMN oxidoreductase RutF